MKLKMSDEGGDNGESNGNSAFDWEIFDILCKDDLDAIEVSYKSIEKKKL